MENEIICILKNINPKITKEMTNHLIDEGLLDSLGIVRFVEELSNNYNVVVDIDDIIPENFNSIDGIINLIKKYKGDYNVS